MLAGVMGIVAAVRVDAAGVPAEMLFTGKFDEEFGVALGAVPSGTSQTQRHVQTDLDPRFRPFTRVTLGLAHPSRSVYRIWATAKMRTEKACVAALEPLRARLEKVFGVAMKREEFQSVRPHVGYYGSRGTHTRHLSCSGNLLSVTLEDFSREGGCDPLASPAVEPSEPPPAMARRFPHAQPWTGRELDVAYDSIARRAETLYQRRLREVPCLGMKLTLFVVVEREGAVQAVETAGSVGYDEQLAREIADLVSAETFPRFDADELRMLKFTMTLHP